MSDEFQKPRFTRETARVFTSDLASRDARTYPYSLTLMGPEHPSKNPWSPSQAAKFEFEMFRFNEALTQREAYMKAHLQKERVDDYKVERGERAIDFFFATQHDRNLAKMAFLSKGPFVIEYSPQSPDIPFKQARKRMFKLRDEYRQSGNGGVHFQFDKEDKTILVIARNRRAYVDFLGNSFSIVLPTMG